MRSLRIPGWGRFVEAVLSTLSHLPTPPRLTVARCWLAVLRARARTRRFLLVRFPRLVARPANWSRRPYSSKLAWRSRNPDPLIDYERLVDKARAKEVASALFPVPATYAVVNDPAAISSLSLPADFVMKATHGWNMSLLVVGGIAQSRNRSDQESGRPASAALLTRVAREWLASLDEVARQRREQQYPLVRPAILFEQVISPVDYELQCFLFDGRCAVTMVRYRSFDHRGSTHHVLDANWQLMPPLTEDAVKTWEPHREPPPRPPEDVFRRLEQLCGSFEHVRADVYVCAGEYWFGEFTFTHAAGTAGWLAGYDAELGACWK